MNIGRSEGVPENFEGGDRFRLGRGRGGGGPDSEHHVIELLRKISIEVGAPEIAYGPPDVHPEVEPRKPHHIVPLKMKMNTN